MAVLSDKDILDFIERGGIKIEPFSEDALTPNGYDLSVGEVRLASGEKVTKGSVKVPPKTWFLVSTLEYIKLRHNVVGHLWLRTTYARQGILATFGVVDAGFEGNLTLSAYNSSSKDVEIKIGDRFVQIVFQSLLSVPKAVYEQRSGRYMRQRGVTLARPPSKKVPCLIHGCSKCCVETQMPLLEDDIHRITLLGFERDFFTVEKDGWVTLRNQDGKCVFLEDGLCSIYQFRPEGCRLYPIVYDPSQGYAALDEDCPYRDEFKLTPPLVNRVSRVVEQLYREREKRLSKKQ